MANKAISTLPVGSIIKLNESGNPVEFYVCKHDYESELNGSGRTLVVRKDCYDKRAFSGINNAFSGSSMDTWLNNTWLKLLDADIQALISTTKFYCLAGNGSAGKQTLTRAVFLLSVTELRKGGSSYNDGTALDSAVCDQLAIAYCNGSAESQWTRTPSLSGNTTVLSLSSNGKLNIYSAYYSTLGSRPAFTLPSTTLVDDSGNVVTVDLTAHKTLINGTAYDVKGGKCLVNGTVYSIKKGRTLIGGTGYDITFAPSYDPVFANNTWEQIIEACHNKEVPDTWNVADQKPMTINGVDYQIDIIGKNHDDYAAGGKAPLTLQLHDCYADAKQMNSSKTNSGGWTSCTMRSTHLPAILALMPTEVQNGIREVNKLTSAGSQSATINTTVDKLFLLSEIEIFGRVTYSKSGEGTQYDYYKADNIKVKNRNGIPIGWLERSPVGSMSLAFCFVQNIGSAYYTLADNTFGVAFGFCF